MSEDVQALLVRLEANATKMISETKRASAAVSAAMGKIDKEARQSNQSVNDALARKGRQMQENAGQYRNLGFAAQNAAFQVGDFFTQVAGGTSPTRAMAQQLPQLLGSMGLVGAIAGAAAAALIPFVGGLFSASEELKKIDAMSLEQVRSRIGELKSLQEQYNEVLALSATTTEENTRRQLNALDQEYEAKLALFRLDAIMLEQRKRQIQASVQEQLRQVEEMRSQLALLDDPDASSSDFVRTRAQSEQLALFQKMVSENKDLFLSIARNNAELELVNLALDDAQDALGGATSLADALGGALGGAASSAATLAENLRIARGNYINGLLDSGISGPDAARRSTQWAGQPASAPQPTGAGMAATPVRSSGGGGGGSAGGGGYLASEAKRIYDETRTAAEKYRIEEQRLGELLRANAITQDTYGRAIEALQDKYRDTGDALQQFQDAFRSGFSDMISGVIDGSMKAEDAVKRMMTRLASIMIENQIFSLLGNLMPNVFGAGGFLPLTKSAMGNVFMGGRVQAFATGGVVNGPTAFPMRGGMGLMGEAGPEAILPLTRVNGSLGVRASGAGGGSRTMVQVINQGGGEVRQERQQGPGGDELIRITVGKQLARGDHDSAMRGRYSARPAGVKR